ncbi:MAG: class I tRNA ligase family protein [Spirochaetales bacterium]|nr:class I tRNA ligase family protein [Spirochaetales bacterium]
MSKGKNQNNYAPAKPTKETRPSFPQRAVITGGMPYGNKSLHLGHIGGVFVHADIFARFMRDRIGEENVIFVSGTDCYGSPIVEYYRKGKEAGEIEGSIEDFVLSCHEKQKKVLESYSVSPNLYGTSAFGRAGEIHKELGARILKGLHEKGHLKKFSFPQFYDPELGVFLNGRQVVGKCPVPGCRSEKGYADECDLGHPYEPKDLIDPKSSLTGKTPEMREVSNWYIDLPEFRDKLTEWADSLSEIPGYRRNVISTIKEFLAPPRIYVMNDYKEDLEAKTLLLTECESWEEDKKSIILNFASLEEREKATEILNKAGIRFRAGKTLTPFRMTGNVEWSLPAPDLEDLKDLTFWVWPESLWTPISFTAAYLESLGKDGEEWKKWWSSEDAQVFQFIGEDNIYFYSLAEMAIFMGFESDNPHLPGEGELQLPKLVANCHLLQGDKKASSSGEVKAIMADDLLNHYTPEQLRAHFFSLGLAMRPISFRPKPFNPDAQPKDADPVLKEGNLLSNVMNRLCRSCFYTTQKYFDGLFPQGEVSPEVREEADQAILNWENVMHRQEFHRAMSILDKYIRSVSKYWAKNVKNEMSEEEIRPVLVNVFHMVRTAVLLLHPVAPEGTEMVRDYLNVKGDFFNWDYCFEPISHFIESPEDHKLKFLEPRVDFFKKHPSQF